MAASTPPSDGELQDAIKKLFKEDQSLQSAGVGKILSRLKASNPVWDTAVTTKLVRSNLQAIKSSPNDEIKETSKVESRYAINLQYLSDSIQCLRNKKSHSSCENCYLLGVYGVQQFGQKLQSLGTCIRPPSDLDRMLKETQNEPRLLLIAARQFLVEWEGCLGPDPREPIAPVCPPTLDSDPTLMLEPASFPTLFPYGTGYHLGPGKHPVSFRAYVVEKLQCIRFQRHPVWSEFALTMAEDWETVAMLNMFLVALHDRKVRHLGKGNCQSLPVGKDFPPMKLEGTILVPA